MGKEPATWGPKLSKGPGIDEDIFTKHANTRQLFYFSILQQMLIFPKRKSRFPQISLTHPKNQQRTVPPVAKNQSQSRLSPPAGHSAWTRPWSHPISVGKYWKMLLTTASNNSISIIIIIMIMIIMIWVNSNISLTWIVRPIKGDDSPKINHDSRARSQWGRYSLPSGNLT